MIKFNKEELLSVAKLSSLQLDNQEIETFVKQLQLLLSYTTELEAVTQKITFPTNHNINVFRDDRTVIQTDSKPLLSQAPQTEDTYFVVPKIL